MIETKIAIYSTILEKNISDQPQLVDLYNETLKKYVMICLENDKVKIIPDKKWLNC